MDPTEGVLLIGKNWENGPVGEGYKPSFAGVVTLLRPGTGALRGLGNTPSRCTHTSSFPTRAPLLILACNLIASLTRWSAGRAV